MYLIVVVPSSLEVIDRLLQKVVDRDCRISTMLAASFSWRAPGSGFPITPQMTRGVPPMAGLPVLAAPRCSPPHDMVPHSESLSTTDSDAPIQLTVAICFSRHAESYTTMHGPQMVALPSD